MKPKIPVTYYGNRDFTIAYLELMLRFEKTTHEWLNGQEPPGVYSVAEYKDGILYVYFDQRSIGWMKEQLVKNFQNDSKLTNDIISKAKESFLPVVDLLKHPKALDRDELKNFLIHLKMAWSYLTAMWWLLEEFEGKPQYASEFNALLGLRKETDFVAPSVDSILFRTFENAYPHFKKNLKLISVEDFLQDEVTMELLEKRTKYTFVDFEGVFTGDQAEQQLAKYDLIKPVVNKSDTLKGSIAFKGKYIGKVKIVLRNDDAHEVVDGDVMVASSTIPDWVYAMKKAGAIITDEGGMLSHAAILSRELKIPCVIGTKVATQFFKNGQVVEVDAEKGIVRIIK